MGNLKGYIKNVFFEKLLFFKIETFIVFIIVIPMMVMGVFYYENSKQLLIDNFSDTNQNMLKEVSISLDLVFGNIVDISKQSYNDKTLNDILSKGYLATYNDIDFMVKKVDQIKNSNRYIHSVYLYIEKSKQIISTEHGTIKLDQFSDRHFLKWYQSGQPNLVLANTHAASLYKNSDDVKHVFSVYARLPLDKVNNFNGALIINVDQSFVYGQIIEALNFRKQIPFYIIDKNNRVILARDENALYKDIYSLEHFDVKMDRNSGSFVTKDRQGSYLVVYNRLDERDWTYAAVYPFEDIYGTINIIKQLVVFTSALLVLLSLTISIIFTLKTFRPVEDLTKLIRAKVGLKNEASSQLGYIAQAFQNIYKNNEEMKQKLELTLPVFKDRFLNNLIKGYYKDGNEIITKLGSFGIDVPKSPLILSVFQIDDYEGISSSKYYDENILKFSMINIIDGFLASRGIKAFYVEDDISSITVVLGMENTKISELLTMFRELQDILYKKTGSSVTIGICDTEAKITELKDSYRKAKEVLKYKILYGKKEIILYSDIGQESNSQYVYPYDKEEYLKNYIRVCDKENAIATLKDILKGISKVKNISYFHIYQLIIQLNNSLINLLNEVNIPLKQIYRNENLVENLLRLQSIDEVEFFFNSIIEKIISVIKENRESRMDKYFQKIVSYVESRYMDELSLELVSEEINLSPTYINQILKNNINKTFVQLLNETRVEKACELLEQGNFKVKEIAEKVGYSSSKYFIKIFKEIKGVTPGKYKAY